jgi:hypothetical protein
MCLLAVLGTSLGAAVAGRTVGRPPARAEVAAAVAGVPDQGPIQTYTASITSGASQNDLYDWLAGRAGSIVHLVLSISKPVVADLKARPQAITLSSKCSDPSPPSNCARSLNLSGTRYLIYGDPTGLVTAANGLYNVNAYVAVDPIKLDSKNIATLPLRIVVVNGSSGEKD